MPDREKVIKGCEYWVNNHKGEDLLIAYSSVVDLLAMLKEQDEEMKAAYRRGLETGRTIKWD